MISARQHLFRLTLLLALFALGGCSAVDTVQGWFGKSGAVEPAKLQDFAETAKFEVRWHADVGSSGANVLQPALTADAIYGASGDGMLTRIDRASGKQVWRIESGITVSGGVGAGEGLVLIGSNKGDVLAYDEDGKLRWKSKVSSEVLSTPQAADGIVVVRSGDGRIAGLDTSDGKRVWEYERSTPALVVRSHAGVTIQRGVAFAGFAGGKLAALKVKDGSVLWENSVSQPRGNTELERISDITSNPVADDEQVCAIAFQGRVACYDAAQGSPLWNRDIGSDKGMMLLRKYLYLTDANGSVMALDKVSGSTLWKNEQLFMRDTSIPYAIGNFVVAGDYEGYLHGLSREDGSFAARIRLDGAIQAAPQQLDDGLLVQTRDGDLYSLSLK
ncbi:outer membrane protein assembly factor BamB [Ferrigenium kumadai]|uniref:Outer membrane protein assembly factor BamB n=1 Tax=Ferrigenium kumadai TaxID=1682490 RepID=A0AAN1SZH5_9PROT|nr:outer membrane protein assembly factor BamB [Ferrigenium kumadai]BBI99833.1 outer membrane protein assembly factor BamB [Ferrigenium kumadai]